MRASCRRLYENCEAKLRLYEEWDRLLGASEEGNNRLDMAWSADCHRDEDFRQEGVLAEQVSSICESPVLSDRRSRFAVLGRTPAYAAAPRLPQEMAVMEDEPMVRSCAVGGLLWAV